MELGIILLIVVLIFGVGKLPEIGSAAGKPSAGSRKPLPGLRSRRRARRLKRATTKRSLDRIV
jgi:Sec-independent protein translocase protein TatA